MFRSLALSCPDGVVVADSDGVVHLLRLPQAPDALPEIGARAGQGYLGAPAVMVEDLPETLDRLRR